MKKLTALFLAVLMVFVVAGCQKETEETAPKKTNATPAPTATATPEETETPADAETAAEDDATATTPAKEENPALEETVSSEEKTAPVSAETSEEKTVPADTGASSDNAVSAETAAVSKASKTTEATASQDTAVSQESLVGTYNLTELEMDGQVAPLQGESPLTVVLNADGTGTYGPNGRAISINWVYENNSVILTAPDKETPLTLLVRDGKLVQQGADGNAIYTK